MAEVTREQLLDDLRSDFDRILARLDVIGNMRMWNGQAIEQAFGVIVLQTNAMNHMQALIRAYAEDLADERDRLNKVIKMLNQNVEDGKLDALRAHAVQSDS